jgi:thiol-disulfide isomerase/thioredoxin
VSRKNRSPHTRPGFAAAVTIAALALTAGCGPHGHDSEPMAQAVSAEAPVAGHPMADHAMGSAATVPTVLDFTAKTLGGQVFEGSSVVGKKAVFWFWAPGCMDCVREAPHLLAMEKAFHNAVRFIGVPGLGDSAARKAAVEQMKIGGFTQVADPDGAIWKRFGVVAQPAYAFIDADGSVEVVKGALGAKGMKAHVVALAAT